METKILDKELRGEATNRWADIQGLSQLCQGRKIVVQ